MPISIQDFERGQAPNPGESEDCFEAKAQKFLQAHREQAFTLEEIVRGAGFLAPMLSPSPSCWSTTATKRSSSTWRTRVGSSRMKCSAESTSTSSGRRSKPGPALPPKQVDA